MLFLYRFFCGILEVRFSGVYPEKIFNLFAKNRITVWNSRFKDSRIHTFITVKDFKRLRKILKKSGVRVHILKKKGFPFFISRYKKRFGIFAGIILFFCILQYMSGYIWVIDINGNKEVSDREIISACEELGIESGCKRSGIDAKIQAQELLLKNEKLSWASLNIEGCKLTVNVTEVTPKSEDTSVATNLKASADGVIKKIDITMGNSVVKVGDTVKKGDLLVSGIIENMRGTKFVHSMGSVTAETEEILTLKEDYKTEITYPTGKQKNKYVLEFFTLKIPLYIGSEKGEFKSETEVETLELFSQKLPISVYKKKFTFIEKQKITRSYAELCERLENQLKEKQEKEDFTLKSKEFIKSEDSVTLKAVISRTKDITYSENIIFGIGN